MLSPLLQAEDAKTTDNQPSGNNVADTENQTEEVPIEAGAQVGKKVELTIKVPLQYLLALPEGYDSQEEWPLLLFLHGAGERGDDLNKVTIHGPPKQIKLGQKLPFIVVSPQCPSDQRWDAIALDALVDDIAKTHKVDTDRMYVTGLSMGGFGTWALAGRSPHKYAAIAPICGGAETWWSKEIKHLPCWVFHGAKDYTVPLRRSEEMVEALKKQGSEPKFTVYPDAGHDSWTASYDNPELYEWMLKQKRQ